MCLHVATILGDLQDQIVVVGGLVPYLIVDQEREEGGERHVGTQDLDLGLSLGVLDQERYQQIAERLRARGFRPATNERGNPTRQTWSLPEQRVTIDFLIEPATEGLRPGSLQNLEPDLAAIVTPALSLAFRDVVRVNVEDRTLTDELARREIQVCGPAAFIVMKSHAFRGRGENKDAYDLVYVLRNFGEEPVLDVARRLHAFAAHPATQAALTILGQDFASTDHLGPRRYAAFLGALDAPELRAEAYAAVQELLRRVRTGK